MKNVLAVSMFTEVLGTFMMMAKSLSEYINFQHQCSLLILALFSKNFKIVHDVNFESLYYESFFAK